jgi:hypothetical protein
MRNPSGWPAQPGYTRFAWAGGTFFLVVLYVVSVFGSGGKKVLVQICMYYLEYKKNLLVVHLAGCAVVSVFGSGGK